MALLRSGAVLVIALGSASCYEPELRDCTVSCASQDECAAGQVCGTDKLCAAPEIAGRCASLPGTAGEDALDAGTVDATVDARPDAPDPIVMVPMHLKIDGDGRVTVPGQPTCEKQGSQNGDCIYQVQLGVAITLGAEPYSGRVFESWAGAPCALQGEMCTFVPIGSTDIHARFH